MNINVEQTLQRRAAALLEIKFLTLARDGKSVSAAYMLPTPVKMKPKQFAQQWTY